MEQLMPSLLRENDPLTPCPPLGALLAVIASLAAGRGSEDLNKEYKEIRSLL
jgi:hypothetical protein